MAEPPKFIISLLVIVMLIPGCLPRKTAVKQRKIPSNSLELLEADQYAAAIEQLLETSQANELGPGSSAATHRQLALLHASPKNPRRNFLKAMEELKLAINTAPAGPFQFEGEIWLSILQELTESRARERSERRQAQRDRQTHQKEISRMKAQILDLREETQNIQQENARLKETIDQLKYLDLNLERKRKIFE